MAQFWRWRHDQRWQSKLGTGKRLLAIPLTRAKCSSGSSGEKSWHWSSEDYKLGLKLTEKPRQSLEKSPNFCPWLWAELWQWHWLPWKHKFTPWVRAGLGTTSQPILEKSTSARSHSQIPRSASGQGLLVTSQAGVCQSWQAELPFRRETMEGGFSLNRKKPSCFFTKLPPRQPGDGGGRLLRWPSVWKAWWSWWSSTHVHAPTQAGKTH